MPITALPTGHPHPHRAASHHLKSRVAAESPDSSPLQPSNRANILPSAPALPKMNDDAAEKAARRKSAHFGDLGHGEPGGAAGAKKRVVSALAVQAQQHQQQQQGQGGGTGHKRAKRLSAVAPSEPIVSMEVMSTNFEEWMKLATDNKITATNTWNFALIDYFADLTLLRNDEDQSINFQKASCTLDGCVKIWTSRVDSVATETGKLLSGLAGGGGGDEVRDEGEEGDEEEGTEGPAKRKAKATLAKSFAALQVKKFDLEFTVDPLFKKTSADFDEGGAMGLLMNHLSVDGKGRVVFDAGDAGIEEEAEEEEDVEDEPVDLDKLREFLPSAEKAKELNISDTLAGFRFSSDPETMTDFVSLVGLKDSFNDEPSHSNADFEGLAPTGEEQDFFGDDDYDAPVDMGGGGFDDGASVVGDGEDREPFSGALGMARPGEGHLPFDPTRQGRGELVMALVGGEGEDQDGMFDYFDRGFGKNWAGAEHWKLRKVARKDVAPASTGTREKKAPKAAFTIDFASPSTSATSSKTLFTSAPKSSLTLSSNKATSSRRSSKKGDSKKRKDEYLLPDDMHFSSRQLLRLFLKPKFSLRMRRNAASARMAENPNGEIDENFWAQAAADRADFGDQNGEGMDMGSGPIPFESQFFHDDDADDQFVDDGLDALTVDGDMDMDARPALEGDEEDLWQGSQGIELKKSKPENVAFAKKAKRVDVKRLKDDIWTGLKSLIPEPDASDRPENPQSQAPLVIETAKEEGKTFDNIITSLRSTYPREKMSEISTSFCFICLLHLANEEGLRLETARYDGKDTEDVGFQGFAEDPAVPASADHATDGVGLVGYGAGAGAGGRWGLEKDKGEKRDRVVGELQALRVYKDPDAGRAA